jgi:hypothetical protein
MSGRDRKRTARLRIGEPEGACEAEVVLLLVAVEQGVGRARDDLAAPPEPRREARPIEGRNGRYDDVIRVEFGIADDAAYDAPPGIKRFGVRVVSSEPHVGRQVERAERDQQGRGEHDVADTGAEVDEDAGHCGA